MLDHKVKVCLNCFIRGVRVKLSQQREVLLSKGEIFGHDLILILGLGSNWSFYWREEAVCYFNQDNCPVI